jgi:hypothetical protein
MQQEPLERKMLFGPRQSHVDTGHSTCAALLLQLSAVFLFLFHSDTFFSWEDMGHILWTLSQKAKEQTSEHSYLVRHATAVAVML